MLSFRGKVWIRNPTILCADLYIGYLSLQEESTCISHLKTSACIWGQLNNIFLHIVLSYTLMKHDQLQNRNLLQSEHIWSYLQICSGTSFPISYIFVDWCFVCYQRIQDVGFYSLTSLGHPSSTVRWPDLAHHKRCIYCWKQQQIRESTTVMVRTVFELLEIIHFFKT